MVSKIANKDLTTSATGKVIRTAEDEQDDEVDTKQKTGKDTQKIKNAIKQSKEEEKQGGGGDIFGKASEGQSSKVDREKRLAELKAKQEARKKEVE